MIKKLHLNPFGKFRDAIFEFAPVTIFFGKNESGKTTIFHAIFDALVSPPGNISEAQELTRRYGKERNAEIVFAGERVTIPIDEYLNIYAIGAGTIRDIFSREASWTDRVKAKIFSGGIDATSIAKKFESLSSDKQTRKHMKIRNQKKVQFEKANERLKQLEDQRNRILANQHDIDNNIKQLAAYDKEIENLTAMIQNHEHTLEQQEQHQKLEQAKSVLVAVEKRNEYARLIEHLSPYREDKTEQIKRSFAAVDQAKASLERLKSEMRHYETQRTQIRSRLAQAKNDWEAKRLVSDIASQLIARIEANAKSEEDGSHLRLSPIGIASGAILLIAGITASFLLYPSLLSLIPLILGIAASIAAAILLRKKPDRERPDIAALCASLKDEWLSRTNHTLASSTLEGIQRELIKAQSDADAAGNEARRLGDEENSLNQTIEELSRAIAEAGERFESVKADLDDLMRPLNVRTIDEYASRRTEYLTTSRHLNDITKHLQEEMERYHAHSIDELKAECARIVNGLEKEIVSEKISEVEINRIKREMEALKHQRSELSAKRDALRSRIDLGRGQIQGTLGDLPQRIYETRKEIAAIEREIRQIDLDREAARIAAEIFYEISRDSDTAFAEIAEEIQALAADLFGNKRQISFKDFNSNDIAVEDAAGTRRSIPHLSTGTRDAFILAARLAFARRSWKEERPGIIVMDEPFHTLDDERINGAVTLLQHFHEKHKWQIILFTKDQRLAEHARSLGQTVKLYDLNSLPQN